MILLPVDEAYALDYYSILAAKQDNGMNVKDELERVRNFLEIQMPFEKVTVSTEYQNLYIANLNTFRAIEYAHNDKIKASEVQKINHHRFKAKVALQKKFWPDKALAEIKSISKTHDGQIRWPTVRIAR